MSGDVQQEGRCARGGEGDGEDHGDVYTVKESTKEVCPTVEKEDDSGPRYAVACAWFNMASLTMDL